MKAEFSVKVVICLHRLSSTEISVLLLPSHVHKATKSGKSPNSSFYLNTVQQSVITKYSISQKSRTSRTIVNNWSEKISELRALAGISFTDTAFEWPGTVMFDTAHETRFVKVRWEWLQLTWKTKVLTPLILVPEVVVFTVDSKTLRSCTSAFPSVSRCISSCFPPCLSHSTTSAGYVVWDRAVQWEKAGMPSL